MKFADTSFWVALFLRRDANHEVARRLWADRGEARLLVTNHVRGELWTFLRRRDGHAHAAAAVRVIAESPTVELVHITSEVEDDAWRWLELHDERSYSFVDATSFAVMRRRRLHEALAFDGDFAAAGFVEVRPTA